MEIDEDSKANGKSNKNVTTLEEYSTIITQYNEVSFFSFNVPCDTMLNLLRKDPSVLS